MVKGFKDDKNRFRPTGRGQPVSKVSKTIDVSRGTLITQPEFEFIPREGGVSWELASERFIEFRKDIPDEEGFTFDPETNKGFDFNDTDEALEFHDLFVEGGDENPVFVIGVQNQLGRNPTRASQSAYEKLRSEGKTTLIGGSFSELTQEPFTDISFAVSGINKEEALDLADESAQDSIAVVFNDGGFFIENVPQ